MNKATSTRSPDPAVADKSDLSLVLAECSGIASALEKTLTAETARSAIESIRSSSLLRLAGMAWSGAAEARPGDGEDGGEQDAPEEAGEDLLAGMAEQLLELGGAEAAVLAELLDDLVEDLGLHPRGVADGRGVEHRDDGEDRGEGEDGGIPALREPEGGGEPGDRGGVGARHPARGDEVTEVDAARLGEVDRELDRLRRAPREERGPERDVREDGEVEGVDRVQVASGG